MLTAYKVLLAVIILITLIGSIGERNDKKMARNMAAVCCVSIVSLLIAFTI